MSSGTGPQELLLNYLNFYSRTWAGGDGRVCKDPQLTDQARQVLTQSDPANRFTLLPFFCSTVIQNLEKNPGKITELLLQLIKAAEILEMLCINLFLFPWKKEIKRLKKFTGMFVYHIQPVLEPQSTRRILQRIGYEFETDTEFRLSENVDPDAAKQMGLELFLARLECENLLEMMNNKSPAECLEIIRDRMVPHIILNAATEDDTAGEDVCPIGDSVSEQSEQCKNQNLFSSIPDQIHSLKGASLEDQEPQRNLECTEGRQHTGFLSEDRSIMEMQESYPDLTIRQKPVFKTEKPKGRQAKAVLANELSGPPSIAFQLNNTQRKLQAPESISEPHRPKQKQEEVQEPLKSEEGSLKELTEKMDQLRLKEDGAEGSLKFPVEETAGTQMREEPIICSPSQKPVCNITDCSTCSTLAQPSHDQLKEPPQSFYIPNCSTGLVPPTEHQENIFLEKNPDQCLKLL